MDRQVLGKCPKCGGDVVSGQYGPYCLGKCGCFFGKVFGKQITDTQLTKLLAGEKVLIKGFTSKKGNSYDMYLTVNGTEEFSYTKKDGTKATGYGLSFESEFPNDKKDDKNPASEKKSAPVIINEDTVKDNEPETETEEDVPEVEFSAESSSDNASDNADPSFSDDSVFMFN